MLSIVSSSGVVCLVVLTEKQRVVYLRYHLPGVVCLFVFMEKQRGYVAI